MQSSSFFLADLAKNSSIPHRRFHEVIDCQAQHSSDLISDLECRAEHKEHDSQLSSHLHPAKLSSATSKDFSCSASPDCPVDCSCIRIAPDEARFSCRNLTHLPRTPSFHRFGENPPLKLIVDLSSRLNVDDDDVVNHITVMKESALAPLLNISISLNLSSNYIVDFSHLVNAIVKTRPPHLRLLDLRKNHIKIIPVDVVHLKKSCPKLKLLMSGNPLSCFCEGMTPWNLTHLRQRREAMEGEEEEKQDVTEEIHRTDSGHNYLVGDRHQIFCSTNDVDDENDIAHSSIHRHWLHNVTAAEYNQFCLHKPHHRKTPISIFIIVTFFIVIAIILFIALYVSAVHRKEAQLFLWTISPPMFFCLSNCLSSKQDEDQIDQRDGIDTEFEYDFYISYANADFEERFDELQSFFQMIETSGIDTNDRNCSQDEKYCGEKQRKTVNPNPDVINNNDIFVVDPDNMGNGDSNHSNGRSDVEISSNSSPNPEAPSMTYFLRDDPFHGGLSIGVAVAPALLEAIDASRCFLALVSAEYLRDEWRLFEFRQAHHLIIEDPRREMKLILLDDAIRDADAESTTCCKRLTLKDVADEAVNFDALKDSASDVGGRLREGPESLVDRSETEKMSIEIDVRNHVKMKNYLRFSDRKFEQKWKFFVDTKMRSGKKSQLSKGRECRERNLSEMTVV